MLRKIIRTYHDQRLCITASIVLACAGCGTKSLVAPVHGKVNLDGKPLTAGHVVTLPEAGRGSYGVIKNGEFELSTFAKNDGALVGTHKVAVAAQEKGKGTGPEAGVGKLLVPGRFTNPESSGLSIDVKAGEVNTPTLELTSP